MIEFLGKFCRVIGRFRFPLFILLALLAFFLKDPPSQYLGSSRLVVSDAASECGKLKPIAPDKTSRLIWPTESEKTCEYKVSTASIPANIYKAYLRFSIGALSKNASVDIKVGLKTLRVQAVSPDYKDYFVEIGDGSYPFEVEHVSIKRVSGGVYIREKVDFVSSPILEPRIVKRLLENGEIYEVLIVMLLAGYLLSQLIFYKVENFPFLYYVLISIPLFLSPALFYYFDEWHILERFSKLGLSGVIHTHNEHSIIAFFAWYYAFVNLFRDHYIGLLILSIILHVFCAYSLERFLLTYSLDRKTVRASVLFFILSSLHAEVLHWAFEQSIILSCISGIWGLIYLKHYTQKQEMKSILFSGLFLTLSPLFFGNGFVFYPLAFFVLLSEFRFFSIKLYLLPSATLLVSALVPVIIYQVLKHSSAGHGVDSMKDGFDAVKILGYILTGSGLGTVARGLGIYPNMTLSTVQTFCYEVFGNYSPWLDRNVLLNSSVEASLGAYSWLVIVLILVSAFYFNKSARKFLLPSLIGLALVFLSFLLPAIGRFQLGEVQSLSLRYQYSSMLGFSILICPLFYLCLETKISRVVFYICALVWVGEQAVLVNTFTYFTDHGALHRVYVQELLDWDKKALKSENSPYEGEGEMNGLFPLPRPSITPGTHPKEILQIYKWLSGKN